MPLNIVCLRMSGVKPKYSLGTDTWLPAHEMAIAAGCNPRDPLKPSVPLTDSASEFYVKVLLVGVSLSEPWLRADGHSSRVAKIVVYLMA